MVLGRRGKKSLRIPGLHSRGVCILQGVCNLLLRRVCQNLNTVKTLSSTASNFSNFSVTFRVAHDCPDSSDKIIPGSGASAAVWLSQLEPEGGNAGLGCCGLLRVWASEPSSRLLGTC